MTFRDFIKESNLSDKDIIKYIKINAKTQGFYGNLLQKLDDTKKNKEFFSLIQKNNIDTIKKLETFIKDNDYFRNKL